MTADKDGVELRNALEEARIALEAETYRAMTWPTPTHWMPLPSTPTEGAQ